MVRKPLGVVPHVGRRPGPARISIDARAHTANAVRAAWSSKEFTIATKKHLQWAADALGPGTVVRTVEGSHGGDSPWRLGMDDGRTLHEVILRVARGGSRHT